MPTTHHIQPEPGSVYGFYDRDLPPILTIDSGDTVVYRTLDSSWGSVGDQLFGIPVPDVDTLPHSPQGHALCGPLAIRDARAGDTLEIQIGEIRPGRWGHTFGGAQPHIRAEREVRIGWNLDPDLGTATDINGLGLTVPLRPFMGILANAPAEPGRHSTRPPRRVGGNLDCRELVAGSTLWLPIEVDGAIFSVGDGHGVQGDGEVSSTAIECPMDRVELTFTVRKDMKLDVPQADTPAGFLTLGIGDTLGAATFLALQAMLDHLEPMLSIGRSEALALASLVVDLRVTQIVNEIVGVHAVLPHDAFERTA